MIKTKIKNKIKNALQKLNIAVEEIVIEEPSNTSFGDYATSLPFKLTKQLKKSPMVIASEIAKNITPDDLIEKIEIVKPGFVNFWISKNYLLENLNELLKQKDNYGKNNLLNKKRITVEFTDPNPFKEFHIGHLYSNIVGESLCRLFEANGALVQRVNYQGDVGMHVAKSIWGLQQKMKRDNLTLTFLEKKALKERVKYLGQAYALGATKFEEDEKVKNEITVLNKNIYNRDPSTEQIYTTGRQWSLDYFELIYKRLGTKFKKYYFERDVGEVGLKIVKEFLKKGIFQKSKGAVIFPGEKYGLHNRVFINSLGLPTYEAKELGLAPTKYKDWPYDQSIIVTANEINEYFKVLITALKQIFPDLGNKTKHIGHGVVGLPGGKMSSRTGKIITAEWLMDEAYKAALAVIQKTTKTNNNQEKTAEKVGLGAIKYALLKSSIGNNVKFDFGESVNFEGNSGPYLQYVYVRCQSVLNNYKNSKVAKNKLIEKEEINLLRILLNFPYIVSDASQKLSPNLVAAYLYDLAQKFNLFYEKHKILVKDSITKDSRIALTRAVAQVIKNGLYLLGIETVDKM